MRRRPRRRSCYLFLRLGLAFTRTRSSAPTVNVRHDNFIPSPRYIEFHSRGRLPHWQVDEAVYFLTFRLRDSLSRDAVIALRDERERLLRGSSKMDRAKLDAAFSLRLDNALDAGYGSCLLREHAELVASALKHFDRVRYQLHAWCVMPNHVHVMAYVERGREVPGIVQGWKSYTSHVIARGVIWQREYFDRVIRSPREFEGTAKYIRGNPGKAGLVNWPWVG
jgi:REP element-mobilizing transposase RayT